MAAVAVAPQALVAKKLLLYDERDYQTAYLEVSVIVGSRLTRVGLTIFPPNVYRNFSGSSFGHDNSCIPYAEERWRDYRPQRCGWRDRHHVQRRFPVQVNWSTIAGVPTLPKSIAVAPTVTMMTEGLPTLAMMPEGVSLLQRVGGGGLRVVQWESGCKIRSRNSSCPVDAQN